MSSIALTKENFKNQVYQDGVTILVEFWSPGNEVCRMLNPILDQLIAEGDLNATLGRINIDEQDALSFLFDIQELPTLVLFKDCEIVKRLEGAVPKNDILEMLDLVK